MEPITLVLLSVSAVMLVAMPNVILLLSLRRRKRIDERLAELMDRLSSGHEVLDSLLPEKGRSDVEELGHRGGPQRFSQGLATVGTAGSGDDSFLEQDDSALGLACPINSIEAVDPPGLAASAGPKAVELSVEDLAKAISDRVERQQAQAKRVSGGEGLGAGRKPTRLRRVRSRLKGCLRRRTVVVLVPTVVAASIALLIAKPDPTGAVRASVSGVAVQAQSSGATAIPGAGTPAVAESLQRTAAVDPLAVGEASRSATLDLHDSAVSPAGESLYVSPTAAIGSARRAAELFPELAEGVPGEIPDTLADRAGSPVSTPDRGPLSSPTPAVSPKVPVEIAESARPSAQQRVARAEMDLPGPGATRSGRSVPHRTAASARLEYNRGVELFKAHQYGEAIALFRSLLGSGLHTSLVDNCYYWIGESYFALRKFREAKSHFEKVLSMRGTNKALDSRMGLAYCLLELGDTDRAIEELSRVARTSPDGNQAMRAGDLASHLKQASVESNLSGRELGSLPASPMTVR